MAEHTEHTLADLVEGIRTAMVTTPGPQGIQGRPITIQRVDDDVLWFLVGDDASWLGSTTGPVNVSFVDERTWVSVAGTGSTTTDPAVLEDLGNPVSDGWFADDTDPVALRVAIDHVDWWTAPGKLGQLAGMAKAVVGDSPPDIGDRGEIH